MATGYTAVFDECEPSFEEFLWRCTRAMGAMIHMRDHSLGADIILPDNTKDSYHLDSILRAVKELKALTESNLNQIQLDRESQRLKTFSSYKEIITKNAIVRDRYNRMLTKVKVWEVPSSDHQGLKDFMIDQLIRSIEFDCNDNYYLEAMNRPGLPIEEYHKNEMVRCKRDIDYHVVKLTLQKKYEKERFDWINNLMKVVPLPTKK